MKYAFIILFISTISTAQQFKITDIEGEWKNAQGYSIKISNGTATLSSLESSGFPKKLLGDVFYNDIKHKSGNVWTAIRMQWKFLGSDVENGRWASEGSVEMNLSP